MVDSLYTYWTTVTDDELTVEKVEQSLVPVQDDLWVAAICSNRIVDKVEVQRTLLDVGLRRTERALERSKDAGLIFYSDLNDPHTVNHISESEAKANSSSNALVGHFQCVPADALLCSMRAVLLGRLDRLNTFVEMCRVFPEIQADETEDEIAEWEDDPWADESGPSKPIHRTVSTCQPPWSLSVFLMNDVLSAARHLASLQLFEAVQILLNRHMKDLWPYRFVILDSIPEHVHPTEYYGLLPSFDHTANAELIPTLDHLRAQDWSETSEVQAVLKEFSPPFSVPAICSTQHKFHPTALTADEFSAWYKGRINEIISSTTLIDVALATVQHGASQGIPGLDEVGEELSLLSRLAYDAPQGATVSNDWTLDYWRSMSPSTVVHAYLAHSTPASLPQDITRLVMPYLYVLESRAERAGSPDPHLPTRLFFDYILSAPLEMIAAIFEASKPTLPDAQRLIRDDQDMTRLALACLYGSNDLDQWAVMSRIFECLPAWDITTDEGSDADVADTTVLSLGAFVTPSVTRPTCTASDLLIFFRPLPLASLSRALDILDVHLESGEILSRWNVPAPLRWFLQSNADANEQRAWANKMARRAGDSEEQLNTEEDWEWLLEDMIRLSGDSNNGRKSAFGLLSHSEIVHIFFSGLLSTGRGCFLP